MFYILFYLPRFLLFLIFYFLTPVKASNLICCSLLKSNVASKEYEIVVVCVGKSLLLLVFIKLIKLIIMICLLRHWDSVFSVFNFALFCHLLIFIKQLISIVYVNNLLITKLCSTNWKLISAVTVAYNNQLSPQLRSINNPTIHRSLFRTSLRWLYFLLMS